MPTTFLGVHPKNGLGEWIEVPHPSARALSTYWHGVAPLTMLSDNRVWHYNLPYHMSETNCLYLKEKLQLIPVLNSLYGFADEGRATAHDGTHLTKWDIDRMSEFLELCGGWRFCP